MLPPHMRAGAKASVPITQANPLRIASNTTPQPMFTALATTENENTKLFGTLKVTKKPSEEVEKQEVCFKLCCNYLFAILDT